MRRLVWSVFMACATAVSMAGGPDGKGREIQAGVVFTFDDAFVEYWQAAMPIFRRYGAHATFFVSSPQNLSAEKVAGLKAIASEGHAIGCHSWKHLRAADILKEHTAAEYVAMEATPALEKLRELGFAPTSYGYPNSSRTDDTDRELLKQFRHLRTGGMPKEGKSLAESDEFFTKPEDVAKRGCLLGKGVDRAGEEGHPDRTFEEIFGGLERAKARGEIIVLYAHNIADGGPGHYVAPAALEKILAKAKELGLAFYTYDDLP